MLPSTIRGPLPLVCVAGKVEKSFRSKPKDPALHYFLFTHLHVSNEGLVRSLFVPLSTALHHRDPIAAAFCEMGTPVHVRCENDEGPSH